jgi:putative endonuclease
VLDHKCNLVAGITSLYAIHQLVYFEQHEQIELALQRESSIKQMQRIWKLDLIEEHNPDWRDLYDEIATRDVIPELACGT